MGDKYLWLIFGLLLAISIAVVYSANVNAAFRAEAHHASFYTPLISHLKHIALAVSVCIAFSILPPRFMAAGSRLAVLFTFLLLLYATLRGVSLNSASRWVNVLGLQFQPSEAARLALINIVALYLGSITRNSSKSTAWFIIIISGLFCGVILLDNMSTALMLAMVIFILCVIGKINMKIFGGTVLALILISGLFLTLLLSVSQETANKMGARFGTAKARIERFSKKPPVTGSTYHDRLLSEINNLDINGKDMQSAYAKIAISNGGFFGLGPGHSKTRYTLPHPYSDFAFAMILEEYGLVGGFFVMAIYMALLFRIMFLARRTKSLYLKLFSMGIGISIALQAAVNMAVAIGVVPVTGQPLPLISQGGTSLLINAVYFGCLLSISANIEKEKSESIATVNGGEGAPVDVEIENIPEVDQEIYIKNNFDEVFQSSDK